MTQTHHSIPRQGGQHRRQRDDIEARCVAAMWERLHCGVPTDPIRDLGLRNYTPRHAASASRRRVYLPEDGVSSQ